MDDMLAPELASGRFAHSEARLTGREAVADIVTRRGIFVLSVDTSDNLTIRDERGQPSLVRNLKGLADIPGLLETPEEHLERVVRAGELALHRNEWARAVDAWTDAATAENVDAIPELRTVAPQTRAMDSDTMDIGAVHAQMRAAW